MIVPAIIAPQLLEQSRRSIASPAGEKSMDVIEQNSREFCREINITMDTFTRLVELREGCGNVAQGQYSESGKRNVSEMSRLFDALAEVDPAPQIGPWLDTPNPTFEGSTPLQIIECGESDRLWRMVWEFRMGNSGD